MAKRRNLSSFAPHELQPHDTGRSRIIMLERVSNINDFDSGAPWRPDSKALAGIAGTWRTICRVENRRIGGSLPVALGWAFASPPQSGLTWLCFLFPLIEPDRRLSRIRLSEKTHVLAHGRLAVRSGKQTRPNTV